MDEAAARQTFRERLAYVRKQLDDADREEQEGNHARAYERVAAMRSAVGDAAGAAVTLLSSVGLAVPHQPKPVGRIVSTTEPIRSFLGIAFCAQEDRAVEDAELNTCVGAGHGLTYECPRCRRFKIEPWEGSDAFCPYCGFEIHWQLRK